MKLCFVFTRKQTAGVYRMPGVETERGWRAQCQVRTDAIMLLVVIKQQLEVFGRGVHVWEGGSISH